MTSRLRGAVVRLTGLLAVTLGLLAPFGPAQAQAPAPEAPVTCRIGVNIEDLYDLDMAKDTFSAILWIWSLCPTDEVNPLEALSFPTAAGGLDRGPVTRLAVEGGGQYSSRRVQGTFRYNWNMNHYPFDTQHVTILIDESVYGAARLVFAPDTAESFLTPDIRDRLVEWRVSDLALATTITDETSTYGLPGAEGAQYAELAVTVTLERTQFLTFLKLTSGIYAAAFIAFLSFFYDSNDRGSFSSKMGLLVGVLFAVLINMRTADTVIGDSAYMTLVTKIHLLTLGLIVSLALIALRDRRRSDRGIPLRHPDWWTLSVASGLYLVALGAMILQAALS